MRKAPAPKAAPAPTQHQRGPGGAKPPMSEAKGPGGSGFLINHNAFTDARPDAQRGMRKNTGYPNFPTSGGR